MVTSAVLEGLAGTWRGEGEGNYPDLAPFGYREELTIEAAPDWRMLRVTQQTWHRDTGKGLHLEVGLIIPRDEGLLYNCAQDSGRVEVMIGTVTDGTIAWQTIAHANDPRLVQLGRTWWLGPRTLHYEAHLATIRIPEYRRHLVAQLTRA